MENNKIMALLPVASLLELAGVLTLITNDGMLIPKTDIGFTVPAVLPVEAQGLGLMAVGGAITAYILLSMNRP